MFFKAAAILALAANTLAQTAGFASMTSPSEGSTIAAGSVFNIEWLTGTMSYSGPVKIELLGGASPSTLEIEGALGTSIDYAAGKFAWNVDSSLGSDATYGIKITLESDSSVFQYSFPFKISGKAVISTPAAASTLIPATKTSVSAFTTPAIKPSVSAAATPAATLSNPAVYGGSEECDDDEYAAGLSAMGGHGGVLTNTIWLANSAKPAAATPAAASGYPVPKYPAAAAAGPQFSAHVNGTTLVYQPSRLATAPVAAATTPAVGSASGSSTSASSPVKVSGASAAAVGRLVVLSGAVIMALFAL